jgi:hypothetical protein
LTGTGDAFGRERVDKAPRSKKVTPETHYRTASGDYAPYPKPAASDPRYPYFATGLPKHHPFVEPIILDTVLESYTDDMTTSYNTGWNECLLALGLLERDDLGLVAADPKPAASDDLRATAERHQQTFSLQVSTCLTCHPDEDWPCPDYQQVIDRLQTWGYLTERTDR